MDRNSKWNKVSADLEHKLSESDYIRSIRSILNERIFISKSVFPIPIKALNLKSDTSYIRSLKNIEQLNSNFITNDLKNLLLVVKCKNLESEEHKINLLEYLDRQFSEISNAKVNITGQIKSEIYMKKNILNEIILFILFSAILCSLILWYFLRNYRLVMVCVFSIIMSIIYSFSLSNFLFGMYGIDNDNNTCYYIHYYNFRFHASS